MRELVIIGAGGFGLEASLLVEEINEKSSSDQAWNLLGFIDEATEKWNMKYRGYPVLGGWEALARLPEDVSVICVVADPKIKRKMVEEAQGLGRPFATLIHPDVTIAKDVSVGKGVLINKGCLLTTSIKIGDYVLINPGCGIGHDAEIGSFTTMMWRVNISGAVKVGEGCMVGTGVIILQGVVIGDCSTVGAGAVVTKDLPDNCTAFGVPAQVIKQNT